METIELKQLARRLRGALAEAGARISHAQALDLVAALAGLRNWPEVAAFPDRVFEASVTDESLSRLLLRVKTAHSISLDHGALLAPLARAALPDEASERSGNVRRTLVVLPTDLDTSSMPLVYAQFSEQIGESHWLSRARKIKAEIRGAPYLREHLYEQNDVTLALARCSSTVDRFGRMPQDAINDRSLYPAFRFAAQVLSLMDSTDTKRANKIARRVHGAFRNPDEMRAMQFELGMATHFIRRGHAVASPEMNGTGRFDFLIDNLGAGGLEIECKSASVDKGRKIHRREALECHDFVRKQLEQTSRNLHSGLSVVLTVPDRLPAAHSARSELFSRIGSTVMEGKSATLPDGSEVRISDFDIRSYPHLGPDITPQVRADIDAITGTENREAMVLGRHGGGALVFALQSAKQDSFLKYVFDSVEYAAKQLSANRAGVVLVGLDGITPDQLVSTAKQDTDPSQPPTALRVAVSDFLRDTSKSHVVGVGFVSRDSFVPGENGDVSSGGAAYYFPKKDSPLWHPDYSGMFAGLS
jgi:hypothetical protein